MRVVARALETDQLPPGQLLVDQLAETKLPRGTLAAIDDVDLIRDAGPISVDELAQAKLMRGTVVTIEQMDITVNVGRVTVDEIADKWLTSSSKRMVDRME